jgi:hypothetical protein
MRLQPIPGKPCLFTNRDGIFMFFYVDDIVFAYRVDRQRAAELLISKLKDIFEMRDLDTLKFFLRMRVIQQPEVIYLVQDAYAEKLIKKYAISINQKTSTPLPYQSLTPYMGEVDPIRVHTYRQKVGSICYPAIITRSDMTKAASKLAEFLTNLGPYHLVTVDHCIRYMHATRHLAIKFDASGGEKLTIQAGSNKTIQAGSNPNSINQIDSNKQMFETSVDASFANEEGRRSGEDYTFKLFGGLID